MIGTPAPFLSWLQLTRLALVFTALSNIWLVVFWSDRVETNLAATHPPLALRLALTAIAAGGLYIFGMTLNDVMDVRRDRALSPHRPLASGRLSLTTALITALTALLLAVAAAAWLGTTNTLFAIGCAGLIVLYNGGLKYLPGVGLLLLGLIRAANMLIADPGMAYLWPVWLTMSHVIGVSGLAYVLERKRPYMNGGQALALIVGYAFWSLAMIGWMVQRAEAVPVGYAWLGPAAAAVIFVLVGRIVVARATTGKEAGAALMRVGLLWLIIYDIAWMAALQHYVPATALAVLLIAAVVSMRTIRYLQGPSAAGRSPYRLHRVDG
jgi:4-hydroxybenzoate polyprenyltransferase